MTRPQLLFTGLALAAVTVSGLAVAKADNLISFAPDLWSGANTQATQDRLLARTAFTQVLEHRNETLGMSPGKVPTYAPIFPDAMVFDAAYDPDKPTGGRAQYAAAADVPTMLRFYEDAAALAHLPVQTDKETPDGAQFVAGDGHRQVSAKLTKQFKQSTQVDLDYS